MLFLITSCIKKTNEWIEPQLQAYAKQQVRLAINHVVSTVLEHISYDTSTLIEVEKDEQGNAISREYNSNALNKILNQALESIHLSLLAAQNGEKDPMLNKIFFNEGIIYQLPIGYLTNISFLSSSGFKIPIKMRTLNDVSGELHIINEPYGYNNTMIKIMLELEIQAQVITVLNIEKINVHKEIPIIIQVIQGEIPDYIPFVYEKKEP